MKKIWFYFLSVLILLSCKKEITKKPANLIPKEKMTAILYDLVILEGMRYQSFSKPDDERIKPMPYIFKKYKIDSLQFINSNTYYSSDLEVYKKMHEAVKNKLEVQKKSLEQKTKQ